MTASAIPDEPSYGPEDPRTCEQRLQDLRRIARQVGSVNRRQANPAVRYELISQLQQRRARRDDLVQFDLVPDPRGDEVLVVRGELLMRASALDDEHVRRILAAYDLQAEPVDCLDGRLVRLRAPGLAGTQLLQLAETVRMHGAPVSLNYVAPMGVVWKGLGGPEPSTGSGPDRTPPSGQGTPVRVAVVDTGIAAAQRGDGWLTGVAGADNADPLDDLPTPPDGFLDLGAGHGTFAAGVVQQVAPDAELSVYRGIDSDGIGDKVSVACAMVRAVREGAQVLNLSFGLEALEDRPPVAFQVALELIDEIAAAQPREVLLVAAAGNFGRDRPCWPAAFCNVVAVAALTQDLAPADWSTRGFWVDCSTMGEGVRSTYVQGRESPLVDPDPDTFGADSWALWTGTSFAAPQVVGAVAFIAQRDGIPPRQALQRLLDGRPHVPGYGRAVRILPPT